ncbi:GerAB/ArcD/ProY family transporter [Ectobacillus ponti]|uniref:Endospore germination permease n=1 Tax=Ectobacillus ponti TaxID=2961894 RepID=A0AA41XCS3_9BACI|nr:endospore germination permease [Ectobacillus ponti]MCP8971060.1 endospore germination permease [Ectobacillus ponti]
MKQIGGRQLILIGAMYILDSSLVSTTAQTAFHGKQHGWLSFLVPVPFILLVLWLLSLVTKRYPGQDLLQALTKAYPVLGRAAAAALLLFYLYIYTRDVRMFVDFCSVALLPSTPLVVISTLVVITTVWIARGGLAAIGRITELYAPLFVIVILTLPLFVTKDIEVVALRPFFAMDVPGVVLGGWYAFSYVGEILAIAFICTGNTFRFRHGVIGLGIGVGLIMILSMLDILVLGPELTAKFLYPNYELIRQIRVTDFLDRFDLVIVGVWAPTMITKIAYSLYIISYALHRIVPDIPWKLAVSPLGMLGFVCSFWLFKNSLQLFSFTKEWTAIAMVVQLLLPVGIYLLVRLKKPAKQEKPAH